MYFSCVTHKQFVLCTHLAAMFSVTLYNTGKLDTFRLVSLAPWHSCASASNAHLNRSSTRIWCVASVGNRDRLTIRAPMRSTISGRRLRRLWRPSPKRRGTRRLTKLVVHRYKIIYVENKNINKSFVVLFSPLTTLYPSPTHAHRLTHNCAKFLSLIKKEKKNRRKLKPSAVKSHSDCHI